MYRHGSPGMLNIEYYKIAMEHFTNGPGISAYALKEQTCSNPNQ
jgi:hypothetical protein